MSKKKEYPPLSPLAEKIKAILENEVDDWEGQRRVTGLTISAIKIEKFILSGKKQCLYLHRIKNKSYVTKNIVSSI